MNEIFSRIVLKHDTENNWNNSSIIPMQGEFIIYDQDEIYNYPRFKIGDGFTQVKMLPFMQYTTSQIYHNNQNLYDLIEGLDIEELIQAKVQAYIDEAILGGEW